MGAKASAGEAQGLTRVRSAPALIKTTAASACAESIARCSGVFPVGNIEA